jgi:hypothetical protein
LIKKENSVEKKKIKSNHEKERAELIKAHLQRDSAQMGKIINQIKENEHEI